VGCDIGAKGSEMKVGRYLIIFLLLMGFLIVFGNNGLVDNYVMKEKLKILKEENEQIVRENNDLKKEISLLKENPQYVELAARKELGMVRKGDKVFRFMD
jgi:cell division protein FtsB